MGSEALSPDQALHDAPVLPFLPSCEHFAGTARFIEKALRLRKAEALRFDVTCDCEDGAATGREHEQLTMIVDTLRSDEFASERVGVRIHEPTHPMFEVEASLLLRELADRLLYLTIPKVADAAEATKAATLLRTMALAVGLEGVALHFLIETHGALQECAAIAALPGVETLDFGLMDFVSAHQGALGRDCMRTPGQFEHHVVTRAKTEIVAAAVAHGVVPSHNVTIELSDPEQAFRDAKRARNQFGFLRMWSVHPSQIEPIIRGMSAEATEVAFAADVLLLARAAEWAPIRVGSELFDRASYRYLWDLLRRAVSDGAEISDAAKSAFFE